MYMRFVGSTFARLPMPCWVQVCAQLQAYQDCGPELESLVAEYGAVKVSRAPKCIRMNRGRSK